MTGWSEDGEPEDTEPEDRGDDLGVAALNKEVNKLLQEMEDETLLPVLASTSEVPRDSGNNGNHVESASGTTALYKGNYPLIHGRSTVYRQINKEWNEIESSSLEIKV